MVLGIGMDVVDVNRIRGVVESHDGFVTRVFTAGERGHCSQRTDPYPHLAARFAAKEAVFKAFGTGWSGGLRWTDVSVENGPGGRPSIRLEGRAKRIASEMGVTRVHVSITHTDTYAGAQIVLEGR